MLGRAWRSSAWTPPRSLRRLIAQRRVMPVSGRTHVPMSGSCLLCGIPVQRCRIPVANPSDSTGQGSGQSSGGIDETSHRELDFLVDLASHAPGLILGPHEVRLLITPC